ncbi:MgtC/SapB family protein [Bacillus sp. RG28]|uniref:MgtC/SapB family protein n=1 Tax=Gottfriedia endophytica TaxID=2820819 RepID=A0A940SK37_9BACI|nr:MgtC/SapB family protein [Gottfriedia endophytica]MBP0725584.1 MgtC/SapB family protein [Gottfriedia endophytica]
MVLHLDIDIIIKLLISAILGSIIGLERELKRKPIGLKTCLVISIVSCLLTIVSIKSAYLFHSSEFLNITMDPLRLAAQIVSGIGFLGAGVILRRENDTIVGLTTAAMIWGASGIGIAVGAGFYVEALVGVTLLIISVELIPILINILGPKRLKERELILKITVKGIENIKSVIDQITSQDITVKNIKIKDLQDNEHYIQVKISVFNKRRTTEIYYDIQQIDNIKGIEIESI